MVSQPYGLRAIGRALRPRNFYRSVFGVAMTWISLVGVGGHESQAQAVKTTRASNAEIDNSFHDAATSPGEPRKARRARSSVSGPGVRLSGTFKTNEVYPDGYSPPAGRAGGDDGILIYRNTLGSTFFRPGRGQWIADGLLTLIKSSCQLNKVRVRVNGGVEGGGGLFSADVTLYDGCPGEGGQEIPGTLLRFSNLNDDASIMHDLVGDFSDRGICDDGQECRVSLQDCGDASTCESNPPAIPGNIWVRIRFDTDDAGVILGAPAEVGFSDDSFGLSLAPCFVWLGGWPENPHASLWIEIFANIDCVVCTNDSHCDDGVFCNGLETCTSGGQCSVGTTPCQPGATCDEDVDRCLCNSDLDCVGDLPCMSTGSCDLATGECELFIDAGFCVIDEVCFPDGAANPANTCQFCVSSANNREWSLRDAGTACGDQTDSMCDRADTCSANGVCVANLEPAGTPCLDDGNDCTSDECDGAGVCLHPSFTDGTECTQDGLFCTGVETCQAGICISGGDPCIAMDLICDAAAEERDVCTCDNDAACNDGRLCNGVETCGPEGICEPGTNPCDDGDPCTGTEICHLDGSCGTMVVIDCNGNGFEDECDIAQGSSDDLDGNGRPDECDAADGTLIYQNTLGTSLFRPGRGHRVADDLTTLLGGPCAVSKLRIRVSGGVEGGSDSFRADVWLYDGCPFEGGSQIPGTFIRFVELADNAAITHELVLDYSDLGICSDGSACQVSLQNCTGGVCADGYPCDTVSQFCGDGSECVSSGFVCVEDPPGIMPTVWLRIRFDTNEAGIIYGAPAQVGFSEDGIDLLQDHCTSSFGGWPVFPHASFWVELFAPPVCECSNDSECDDGVFCNGAEFCVNEFCQAGEPPCDDDIECTTNGCVETTHTCSFQPDDSLCDDMMFCNGRERCDVTTGCEARIAPCTTDEFCLEGDSRCVHCLNDIHCDDADACTGLESCDEMGECRRQLVFDCNSNEIEDFCDIADCAGDSACSDCNGDGRPDECGVPVGCETTEMRKFTVEAPARLDRFGRSVAQSSSGDRVVVGGSGIECPSGRPCGAVKVYRRESGVLVEEVTLRTIRFPVHSSFGASVAMSALGDRIVVGAPDTNGCFPDVRCGAAYVYRRNGTNWVGEGTLTASDPESLDFFGSAVSMTSAGDKVLVGAPGKNCPGGNFCGAVYEFRLLGGNEWRASGKTPAPPGFTSAAFGGSVAMSSNGDRAVIGTPLTPCGAGGSTCGKALIYRLSGVPATEEARLTAPFPRGGDLMGGAVSMSETGDRVVVGARRADCAAGEDCGAAYVFRREGSNWRTEATLAAQNASPGAQFGSSVSLSAAGDRLAVGAFQQDCAAGTHCGAAYVLHRDDSSWIHDLKLSASDAQTDNELGSAVSLSPHGAFVVVGASGATCTPEALDCGAAYVFDLDRPDSDCNCNGIADACDVVECDGGHDCADCNSNLLPDSCELADNDCDGNDVPDDCQLDFDGDGLVDECDACPDSDFAELIVIEECSTGVANEVFDDGCTMNDVLGECAVSAHSHGELAACVARHANEWRRKGLLSGKDVGRIIHCAGASNEPRPSKRIKDPRSHGRR